MDIFSALISLISLLWDIAFSTKLYIVYIPMIICELSNVSSQTSEKVLAACVILWIAVWVKTIINHFK